MEAPPVGVRATRKWSDFRAYTSAFGFVAATILLVAELSARIQRSVPWKFPSVPVRIRIGLLRHPFTLRLFTSDVWVLRQTFFERHYRDIESAGPNAFVIDLGANIGSYAALVLSNHEDARVVCVEPDPANAAIAGRNVARYGPRAKVFATAIWNEPVALRIERFGAALEWGIRVRPCVGDEIPDMTAITIGEILEREGRDRIDVLKVDIEGAEEQLFAGELPWLDAVERVAIEVHGPDAQRTVELALDPDTWSRQSQGEIDLFSRTTRPQVSNR